MELHAINELSAKDRELFTSICNHLLGRTFIVRSLYNPDGGSALNPEYSFLMLHGELVKQYLNVLGWSLHQDEYNGYFFVVNDLDANRLVLNSKATAVLLALRLIFDENSERAGLYQDVLCHVREVLEKLISDFPIFRQKPNMDDFRRWMKQLETFNIVAKLDGKYSDPECRFTILPTILTAVSAEKMHVLVQELRREEDADEETKESLVD